MDGVHVNDTNQVTFTKLTQVCLFCDDLEKTMSAYSRYLGVGPWQVFDWEAPLVRELKYLDQPVNARQRLCFAQIGHVEFEVIQHVEGESFYRPYMDEHGSGVHQLDFEAQDVSVVSDNLVAKGHTRVQSGRYGDDGEYAIVDIRPLHSTWEPVRAPQHMGKDPIHFSDENQKLAKFSVPDINTISFAVKSIADTIAAYEDILNIGPWTSVEWTEPLIHDFECRGSRTSANERMAFAEIAEGLRIELWQPVGQMSCFNDFLSKHTQQVHHLGAAVDDVDAAAAQMLTDGFECLQRGRWGDDGAFAIMNMPALDVAWKIYREPSARH